MELNDKRKQCLNSFDPAKRKNSMKGMKKTLKMQQ